MGTVMENRIPPIVWSTSDIIELLEKLQTKLAEGSFAEVTINLALHRMMLMQTEIDSLKISLDQAIRSASVESRGKHSSEGK